MCGQEIRHSAAQTKRINTTSPIMSPDGGERRMGYSIWRLTLAYAVVTSLEWDSSPKNESSVIIYGPSCYSKPVWPLSSRNMKKTFWIKVCSFPCNYNEWVFLKFSIAVRNLWVRKRPKCKSLFNLHKKKKKNLWLNLIQSWTWKHVIATQILHEWWTWLNWVIWV